MLAFVSDFPRNLIICVQRSISSAPSIFFWILVPLFIFYVCCLFVIEFLSDVFVCVTDVCVTDVCVTDVCVIVVCATDVQIVILNTIVAILNDTRARIGSQCSLA